MNKYKIITVVAVAVMLLVGAGMAVKNNKQDKEGDITATPLKMIVIKDLGDVNFITEFASEKEFFKRNGVNIENVVLEKISDTRNVNTVLMSDEADVVIVGISGDLALYMNNMETRWLAGTFTPFSLFGVSRFDKDHLDQVKKVGVIRFGGEAGMFTNNMLKKLSIDPAKVELVAIPTNLARKEVFEKGDIDFMIINSEQFLYESELDKKYTVFNPEDIYEDSQLYRGVIATQRSVEEKPKQLQRFITAIHQAMEYLSENPVEAKEYIKTKYAYTDEKAEQFYNRFLSAKNKANFVPRLESIGTMIEDTKIQFKPTNPDRDLSGFVYDVFAKEAITAGAK